MQVTKVERVRAASVLSLLIALGCVLTGCPDDKSDGGAQSSSGSGGSSGASAAAGAVSAAGSGETSGVGGNSATSGAAGNSSEAGEAGSGDVKGAAGASEAGTGGDATAAGGQVSSTGGTGGASASGGSGGSSGANGELLTGVTNVSAGWTHACAALANGSAVCWGGNASGELGNGAPSAPSPKPVPVSGLTTVKAVSTGGTNGTDDEEFSCALLSSGSVYCWGANSLGELGVKSTSSPSTCFSNPCSPLPVQVPGLTNAIALSLGDNYGCAIISGGTVECWGHTPYGDSPTPIVAPDLTDVVGLGTGDRHTICALSSAGTVKCQGENLYGELGNGTTVSSATPVPVPNLANVVAISSQDATDACVVLANGSVECWGYNGNYELGTGTKTGGKVTGPEICSSDACSTVPVPVPGVTGATAVSAGGAVTCALLTNGTVMCWGSHGPQLVPTLTDLVSISAGSGFACGVRQNGTVMCWGGDASELGNGNWDYSGQTPTQVVGVNATVIGSPAAEASAPAG